MSLEAELKVLLENSRTAAHALALAPTERKNRALGEAARLIRGSRAEVLAANRRDLERERAGGRSGAFVERMTLDDAKIEAIAHGVEIVASLPDPVDETIARWTRPNGLEIFKRRVPIGVIAIIYESRPNVTVDAGVLCFKAGNAAVLRGGREAAESNRCLAGLMAEALAKTGFPPAAIALIDAGGHEAIQILKSHPEAIDLIIPRGGSALKQALAGSTVPLLPHFDGLCNTYVDRAADLKMAEEVCFNAKVSRPSVCNAMENLIVHREVAERFLPAVARRLTAAGVALRGCERTRAILPGIEAAAEGDWDAEYLDLILSIKIVDSLEEAIAFIARHSSHLADAIVTEDAGAAARFEREVDSATVYVNASTRFTDGFEFGFGAETGISTNRLHARGPMGLSELTTYKYVIRGNGQVRS